MGKRNAISQSLDGDDSPRQQHGCLLTVIHLVVFAAALVVVVILTRDHRGSGEPPPWESMEQTLYSFPVPAGFERVNPDRYGSRCKGQFLTCNVAQVSVSFATTGDRLKCGRLADLVGSWQAGSGFQVTGYPHPGTPDGSVCSYRGSIHGYEASILLTPFEFFVVVKLVE